MKRFHKFLLLIALHIVPTLLVLYFSCKVFLIRDNNKEGIVKLLFNLNLFSRELPDPFQDIGVKATSLGNLVPDQVSSAIAAAETFVSQGLQTIPKGCSVGTKYLCILYDGHSDCMSIPIQESTFLRNVASVAPPIKLFNSLLSHTPSLEILLGLGLACTLASTIAYAFIYSFPGVLFISAGLSLLGFMSLLIFAIFTFIIVGLATGLEQGISFQRGDAYVGAIGNIISAFVHAVVSMTCWWCGL